MTSGLRRFPSEDQHERPHPEFLANEPAYLRMRYSLLAGYRGQWVAVQGAQVIVGVSLRSNVLSNNS